MSLTSPFNGATATGYLTTPTYTVVSDLAPSANGRQYAVSALGGTQTGVVVSSAANPFTLTVFKPVLNKQLPVVNPGTGRFSGPVPKNVFSYIVRKGGVPLTGQAPEVMLGELKISIPAGVGDADANSLAAFFSAMIGALNDQSLAMINMCKTNVVTF